MKISHRLNLGMWGVYLEARDWIVGALCSDLKLGENILIKSPQIIKFGTLRKRAILGALCFFSRSPKLKSEHRVPTFQSLASGYTPHMPIFGHREIFTF